MKWSPRYTILLAVCGSVLLLDQVTKILVDNSMRLYSREPLINGFLDLHYIRNSGAAFGFLAGSHSAFRLPFFIGVSVIAVGIILYLFYKMEESETLAPIALALVLGGAVGNLVDRIRLGEVIDFIYFHYKRFAWPAFNVADIAITSGVILLIFRMLFLEEKPEEPEV